MGIKLKQSDSGGALRRRPLLPDDRYLDGKISEVSIDEVEDKFNGGKKKVVKFVIDLPEFEDPQNEGQPRRVTKKPNLPQPGKGVHSKSELYKVVCAALGKDPWAGGGEVDLDTCIGKPIRVMMQTSEEMEKEIEEADGTIHTVNDYQFQWVHAVREGIAAAKKVTPAIGDTIVYVDEEGDDAEGVVSALFQKTNKVKVGDVVIPASDVKSIKKPPAAAPAEAAKGKGKRKAAPAPAPEPEVEEEEEIEEEAAAGDDPVIDVTAYDILSAGIKTYAAKGEAQKANALKYLKSQGYTKIGDLASATRSAAKTVAAKFKITLPAPAPTPTSEEADDELDFLN